MSNYIIVNGELYHFGIKGMKWGHRKRSYKSTGIRAALARRRNAKIDKSFKKWKEETTKKETAIELGKKANLAQMAYENNRSDKQLKREYKQANREYKKALGKNTAYRKGVVRQEVGSDISRKYLSEAKKIGKLLDKDPNNRDLQKQYDRYMSKHDVEREKARRAVSVGTKRSRRIAAVKRGLTMSVKAAATTAVVSAGAYAVNRYLSSTNTTFNGKALRVDAEVVRKYANVAKQIFEFGKYFY